MHLTTTAFRFDDRIPARFTCDDAEVSPPLAWSDPLAGTRRFALMCADPEALGDVWHHRAIDDILSNVRGLSEHWSSTRSFTPQTVNDFLRTATAARARHWATVRTSRANPEHCRRLLGLGPGVYRADVSAVEQRRAAASCELVGIDSRVRQ